MFGACFCMSRLWCDCNLGLEPLTDFVIPPLPISRHGSIDVSPFRAWLAGRADMCSPNGGAAGRDRAAAEQVCGVNDVLHHSEVPRSHVGFENFRVHCFVFLGWLTSKSSAVRASRVLKVKWIELRVDFLTAGWFQPCFGQRE